MFALPLLFSAAAFAAKQESIDDVLRDPYLKKVTVGIKIVKLGESAANSKTVYEREPTKPMTPASNFKLLTTSAALDALGPDFKFQTKLVQKGQTLALVGDGDPSLGDAELLSKVQWKSTTEFEKWAEALVARGLKSADKIVYDDSIFEEPFVHPNWPKNQLQKRYVAGVAGLNFNANCVDFYLKPNGEGQRVDFTIDPPTTYGTIVNNCVQGPKNAVWLSRAPGSNELELRGSIPKANDEPISVTVDNPPLFTTTALRDVFTKAGMTIGGEITRDPTVRSNLADWQTLAVHETPIATVLDRANKDSMNLYAEALGKRLGAQKSGVGSWKTGPAAVGAFLESIGIDKSQFVLDDGCGLSDADRISPAGLVAVLEHEYFSPQKDLFLNSLAVAGVDGTLKDRFSGSLRQRVIGKSGFINGVSALSGFLKAKDGSMYVFSILFNGIAAGTNSNAKKLQEKMIAAIDG